MRQEKTFSLAEAAARLGVSVDTVRRRVHAGSLETVPLERGYAVILDQPPTPEESLLQQVAAERDRLLEEVAFLRKQLEDASRREAALLKLVEGVSGAGRRPARSS